MKYFLTRYGIDSMGDMTDMMIEFKRLLQGLVISTLLTLIVVPVIYLLVDGFYLDFIQIASF
jgi:hypothetical protein